MPDGLGPCHFRQVDNHGRILCHLIKGGDREVSVNLCRACPVQQINCQHLRAGLEKRVPTPITVRFATGRVEVWDDAPPAIDFKQAACAAKTMPIHSPRDCAGCPLRLPNVVPANAIQVAHRAKQNAPAMQTPLSPPQHDAQRPKTPRPPLTQRPTAQRAEQPVPALGFNTAADLVARAKATARKKSEEKTVPVARAAAETRESFAPQPEPKSKIIQLQAWLAGQLNRKQMHQPLPAQTDADGVSEIVYAPLGGAIAQSYQEAIDYERCVGWTD